MTRRERREAEAAGVVVPPAVAASPDAAAAAAAAAAADDESAAGAPAAPPAGLPFTGPSGAASAPTADESEPTFTELLGIVRPSGDARESLEDTPGDPAADAGRSDLVDPGPLPAGGSWALSDELPVEDASTPAAEGDELVSPARDDEPVDLDDPFAALRVEAEEDAPDAATAALPLAGAGLAGAGLAGAGATGAAAAAETPPTAAGERPRSVPHTDAELPGLSVEAGSPAAPAAASSGASPLVPRGGPSAPSGPSGPGAGSSAAGPGGGIASWSRGRKVLLGVAAALVIVLALVALFVLSRSLFAGTPQPTEAPAAAVATRTVTAAPAELPQEAAAGPLSTGTHPWSDLQGGECFSAFENAWQQDYEVVDCGQPHVAQLASIGALDADPAAAYPGSDALQSQMSVLCTGASALDLAAASTWADAQFSASWPSTDAEWAAGVRSYWCFVDRASGEPMTTSVAPAAA
nr:septum formation family protein [Frigoribacterium sp. CFBP 8766]